MAEDNDVGPNDALTRRGLLRTGAIGAGIAGAAWVVPSVLTMDAAAAGSLCTPLSNFNWETYNNGAAGLVTDVAGVLITIAISAGAQAVAPNMVVQTELGNGAPFGARSRWWQMRQNAIKAGGIAAAAQQTATFRARADRRGWVSTGRWAVPVLMSGALTPTTDGGPHCARTRTGRVGNDVGRDRASDPAGDRSAPVGHSPSADL